MYKQDLISVIIPTFNSSHNLTGLLESLLHSTYKNFEVIINDSIKSTDHIAKLIKLYRQKGMNIVYKQKNTSMAQARKLGASYAMGAVLMHLDSDMLVSKDLLKECSQLIGKRYDALVIPEESFGTSFWAKCKWLEKKCYEKNIYIESLRVVKHTIYDKLDGHNEGMVFSEDKDFDLRVRAAGYKVGRTKDYLLHDEGNLTLRRLLSKKAGYAQTANLFLDQHPKEAKWQLSPFNRYIIFLNHWKYFFRYPHLFVGMIFMKNLEYFFAGLVLLKIK